MGTTGLVGSHCLEQLLDDERYERVISLTRRPPLREHAKLDARVANFDTLDSAVIPQVDHVYCALGTTIKVAGSQEVFYKIDHDYAVMVAEFARAAGAQGFALVSSVGANSGSRNFYLRVKGKTERDIAALGYPTAEFMRPGLILGERGERRPLEQAMFGFWRVVSGVMVGPVQKYRAIHAATIAGAMIAALHAGEPGTHVRHYADMIQLAGPAASVS